MQKRTKTQENRDEQKLKRRVGEWDIMMSDSLKKTDVMKYQPKYKWPQQGMKKDQDVRQIQDDE